VLVSAVHELLPVRRVALALHRHLRQRAFDVGQVLRRQGDRRGAGVFLQAMQQADGRDCQAKQALSYMLPPVIVGKARPSGATPL
jgi:hypothetical protein